MIGIATFQRVINEMSSSGRNHFGGAAQNSGKIALQELYKDRQLRQLTCDLTSCRQDTERLTAINQVLEKELQGVKDKLGSDL